jgi:hypothetical protein
VIELAQANHRLNSPDYDMQLNEVLVPFLQAIPPHDAARMAVEIAGQLDAMLEECEDWLIEEMHKENPRWVERFQHRNEHLKDIEDFVK